MEKNAADVLEDAADWLLVNGRCRDELDDDEGRGCVMKAFYEVVSFGSYHVKREAEEALDRHLGGPCLYVGWNMRTEDDFEVIDTLRLVAKDLRGKAVPS